MKIHLLTGFFTIGIALLMSSCGDTPSSVSKERIESYTSGSINIAADESFKPVMVQQVNVFDSSYPDAKLNVTYLSENECLQTLFDGKSSMVFVTRGLTESEKKACEQNNIYTKELALAKDGIVILVNNKSQDSRMTVGMVQAILNGEFARKYKVVLDNQNGSVARYITDSILGGKPFSEQVFAVKNSEEVIDYVSKNEDAIGFVGMTNAFDPNSNVGYGSFRKEVQVVSIKNDSLDKFVLPYQASIALGDYPFIRRLYFISRLESNLAAGFANFLTSTPGQKIIDKARMVPLATQLYIQEVEIKP
jgi:phosphate transport system substrate-binding protein